MRFLQQLSKVFKQLQSSLKWWSATPLRERREGPSGDQLKSLLKGVNIHFHLHFMSALMGCSFTSVGVYKYWVSSHDVLSGTTTSWQQAVDNLVEIHTAPQTLLLLLQTRLLPKRSTSSKYFYPCILDIRNHCGPSQIRAPLCQRREDEAMEVTNVWFSITML